MAGGKGERLRPYTDSIPKPLLPYKGSTLIDRIISSNSKASNITIITNYLAEQFIDKYSSKYNVVVEPKYLGTFGGISLISKSMLEDTIVLVNGDIDCDINYESLVSHHISHNSNFTYIGVGHLVEVPFGVLNYDKFSSELESITEKPTYHYVVGAGIYVFNKSLLDIDYRVPITTPEFVKLVPDKVHVYYHDGLWNDVGTVKVYEDNR